MAIHLRTVKINKTRKSHVCIGCNKRFRAGSWLWYHVGVFDGFYADYVCNPCQKEMQENDYSDGFMAGEIRDARIQNAHDRRRKWTHRQ